MTARGGAAAALGAAGGKGGMARLRGIGGGVLAEMLARTPDGFGAYPGCLACRTMPHCLQRIAWESQSDGMRSGCLHPGHIDCTTVDMFPTPATLRRPLMVQTYLLSGSS